MPIRYTATNQVNHAHHSEKKNAAAWSRSSFFVPGVIFKKDQIDLTDTGVNKVSSPNEYSPTLFIQTRCKTQIAAAMLREQLDMLDEKITSRECSI